MAFSLGVITYTISVVASSLTGSSESGSAQAPQTSTAANNTTSTNPLNQTNLEPVAERVFETTRIVTEENLSEQIAADLAALDAEFAPAEVKI